MSRLKGAASKIDWAKEHLDHLDREMGEFLTDPYTITCKDKVNDHRHYLRFEFKPIPISMPLIAGDFCYCLRSGLDQLAWQLTRINKVAQPRTATSFPIFSTKPPNGFKDKTKDLLPVAVEVIEALQLYQRGLLSRSIHCGFSTSFAILTSTCSSQFIRSRERSPSRTSRFPIGGNYSSVSKSVFLFPTSSTSSGRYRRQPSFSANQPA